VLADVPRALEDHVLERAAGDVQPAVRAPAEAVGPAQAGVLQERHEAAVGPRRRIAECSGSLRKTPSAWSIDSPSLIVFAAKSSTFAASAPGESDASFRSRVATR